jgi:hypothetical protein
VKNLAARGVQDAVDRLKFSNTIPTRVKKLERYRISRIAIKEGKFMAFFLDDISSSIYGNAREESDSAMPTPDVNKSKVTNATSKKRNSAI